MRRKKIIGAPQILPAPENCAAAVAENLRARFYLERDQTEILDYGCGSGALSFLLAPHVRRVTAIDAPDPLIADLTAQIAQSRHKNIRALALDLTAAPRRLGGTKFDLIVGVMILHHCENFTEMLRAWKTLLKPDGALAVVDLQTEDGAFHPQNISVPHLGFAPENFADALIETGFFNVATFCPYVIKTRRHNRWREYPLFMAIADNAPNSPLAAQNSQ